MFVAGAKIFSVVLLATGWAKLWNPADTARAITAAGVPMGRVVTFGLGILEVFVGSSVLIFPRSSVFAAQASLYGIFFLWVLWALRLDVPLASCGCLGSADTPPYWGHLMVNAFALLFSFGAAVAPALDSTGELWLEVAQLIVAVAGSAVALWLIGEGARAYGKYSQ